MQFGRTEVAEEDSVGQFGHGLCPAANAVQQSRWWRAFTVGCGTSARTESVLPCRGLRGTAVVPSPAPKAGASTSSATAAAGWKIPPNPLAV